MSVVATFIGPAVLARPIRDRNAGVSFEVRAKGLFENGSRAQMRAQKECEGSDKGGAKVHSDVLEVGGDLSEFC